MNTRIRYWLSYCKFFWRRIWESWSTYKVCYPIKKKPASPPVPSAYEKAFESRVKDINEATKHYKEIKGKSVFVVQDEADLGKWRSTDDNRLPDRPDTKKDLSSDT